MTRDSSTSTGNGPDPETLTPDPDAGALRAAQGRRVRQRRMLALTTLAATLVLGAVGWWAHHEVEQSMRATRGDALRSVLDSEAQSLRTWIDDQKLGLRRLARDPDLRAQALDATRATGVTDAVDCNAPGLRDFMAEMEQGLADSGALVFNLVNRSGRIMLSNRADYCGLAYQAGEVEQNIAPVFGGETIFVTPGAEADRLVPPARLLRPLQPLLWFRAPIRNDAGEVIAALGIGHLAQDRFSAILAAARAGETDEVYAFGRDGVMLSQSRFETVLQERATLPHATSAAGRLVLRSPLAEADSRTRLVEAALAAPAGENGASGMLLDPYPGYLATPVVGGWRRLAAEDLFIAIEMSAAEAYAPLEALDTVFAIVFGVLILAVVIALFYWFTAVLIRAEVEKDRMGPYWLGERIGEGGVGNVYHARHDLLKRPSAVKLLKPSRATDEMTARFRREARLASQLTHPNMIDIYDYGIGVDGTLFYAMELLEGDTVGDLVLRGGAMPVARVVHLLRQVCAGLAEAHGKGLVHRDISVTNIMACLYGGEYDFAKILDFGLVKSVTGEQSQTVTRSVRILGTVQYMAPERLHDPSDVDLRADVYALGAVAFFLLSGRRMFETEDTLALTSRVINEEPPRLSAVASQPIPDELDALVAACLAKKRGNRPADILAVKDVLDRLAETHRWSQADARAAWEAWHGDVNEPGEESSSSLPTA
ncbi:MAG: serine/threonine protein kinase [Gammaproteobacteria bacterium]|nr:serine/threonine protein kinase [Gammaproteobacteria bacterium]